MIQFAHSVGLEISSASYGIFEDLLIKARLGDVGQPVIAHFAAGRSPFPKVAGSTMGENVASQSA